MSNVRLEDIANKLNVSVVTVSNALAGRKGVSDALREQICAEAKRMGYRRLRSTKRQTSSQDDTAWGKRIVVLICNSYIAKFSSFYWEMYQHTAFRASKKGCVAMLELYTREMEERLLLPRIVTERQADGIIMLGKARREYVKRIMDISGVPVVLLDFEIEDLDCDAVISNNFYGMYAMTNHLFRAGHKKIAYVGNIMATGSIMERYQGYCKSLIEHGIEERADWLISDRNEVTGEIRIIDLPRDMPTAFVCNSDYTAALLIAELKLEGYSVPEDISVVGYDNYVADEHLKDMLTTYAVDLDGMANRTLKFLLKRIEGGRDIPKRTFTVDGHMIIRGSVKKIGAAKITDVS